MLVERSGDVDFAKVLDFGLARSMEPEQLSPITQRDVIPGAPAYLAPERANGISDDPRSDLYSVGAMWFELLTGSPPFWGRADQGHSQAHQRARRDPVACESARRHFLRDR